MRFLISCLLLIAPMARSAITITGAEIEPSGESIAIYVGEALTNSAIDFGFTTNANSGAKVRATFTVPGVNNFTENFLGTKVYHMAYPRQSNQWVEVFGTVVRVRVALSKRVTISDTGGLLDVDANWFSNNTAVVGMTITNNSLLTYGSLRPIAMWRSVPWQLEGSNVLRKVVAREYFASSNTPAYSVDIWANSGAVNTPTQTVTQPTIDWNARDPVPVQEFQAWLDYGVFPQGSTVTNHFTVKERRGTNILSTITSPYPFFPVDSGDYAPLVSYCNKSNTWPYVVVLVDATNGSAGVAATMAVTNWSQATNVNGDPAIAAWNTIALAKHCGGLTNNNVNGSNTYTHVYVMFANTNEQQYGVYGGGVTPGTRGVSSGWTHFMPLPIVNKTNVRISFRSTSQVGQTTVKEHWKSLNLDWTTGNSMFDQGMGHMWFDECLIGTNTSSGAALTAFCTNIWVTGCTFLRSRATLLPGTDRQYANYKIWGNRVLGFPESTSVAWQPTIFVGNSIRPIGANQQFILRNDNPGSRNLGLADPVFWAFNEIINQDANITTIAIGLQTNLTVGAVVDHMLLETRNYGTQPQYDIMQSQREAETCTNFMSANVTCLQVYHPVFELGSNQTLRGWSDRNHILATLGFRGDVSGQNLNFTNRWGRYYSVDCGGNASALVGAEVPCDQTFYSSSATRNNGFNGVASLVLSNLPNLANNVLGFVDNRSPYGGTTNGFGNYLLKPNGLTYGGTNMVKVDNLYPADLRGVARPKNNPNSNKRPDTSGVYSQSRLR